MRHDHAERAVVESARAFVERSGADAHDRRDAGRKCGDTELPRLMHRMGAVLHVNEQPVVIGGRRKHRGRAGAQVMDAKAERQLVVLQPEFGFVLDKRHGALPGWSMIDAAPGRVKYRYAGWA